MKKTLTLFAAVMLLASASFAQTARRDISRTKIDRNSITSLMLPSHTNMVSTKAAGDTIVEFPWIEGFESETLTGFTFIDADGDGYNWTHGHTPSIRVNNGEGCIYSASWLSGGVGALTPDNWMILPAFTLPADTDEFNLSWFDRGQNNTYSDEHYSVYICTTGNDTANFTATTPVFDGVSTNEYVKHIVSLSNYGGQTIFIAFRHWNITDMFYLNIDDIRVGGLEPPTVSIAGPTDVEINTPAVFVATGDSIYSWVIDSVDDATTGDTLTTTFTTTGQHLVKVSATNSAGTGSDSLFVNVYDCSAAITDLPWTESFNGNTACWQFATAAEYINDRGFEVITDDEGYDDYAFLVGHYSDSVNTDQWAISPMIALPDTADDYIMKYYVQMNSWEGVNSHYQVLISTTGADTSDFTTVLIDESGNEGIWLPRTIQLGEYAGDTIRIAYHNITPIGGDALFIDAIYIGTPVVPDLAINGPETVIMNETAEWHAYSDVDSVTWTIDGTTLSEDSLTLSYTFTSAGSHTIMVTATNVAGSVSDSIVVNVIDCSQTISAPHTFNLGTEFSPCWANPEDGWDTISLEDGNTYLYSMSSLYGIFDLDPDNWIYTPAIILPAEGSFDVSWKVMPGTTQLPRDHYAVYVVKDGNATKIHEETLNASISAPSTRVASIPADITGDFKIAFRHFETSGGYAILVSDIKVVNAGTVVDIDAVENSAVAVYPNPASNMLMVDAENASLVQVLDVNGRVVLASERAGRLDISDLATGVYVVRVVKNDGVSTSKIVKE